MLLFAQIAFGVVLSVLFIRYLSLIVRVGVLLLLGLVVMFLWLCLWPIVGPVRWQIVRFNGSRSVSRFGRESNSTDGDSFMDKPLVRQPPQLSEQEVGGSATSAQSNWDLAHSEDTAEGLYRRHG